MTRYSASRDIMYSAPPGETEGTTATEEATSGEETDAEPAAADD